MITYAFIFKGEGDWKISMPDDWELDTIELQDNEKIMGHHKIDGSICKIIQAANGQVIAISK